MIEASCKQDFVKNMVIPSQDIGTYDWIRILRLSVIFFSVTFLLINIALILKKKQYKFNTIKLFMFVEIFYVFSLLSVTPHSPSLSLGFCEFGINAPHSKQDFFNCIIAAGEEYWTAIEGYINMLCYALSYWFAVCITLYIKHVLENTHKKFMRKRGPMIFVICFLIALWFLVPFSLSFVQDVPFSFGPAGYKFYSDNELFFYSGIINRNEDDMAKGLVLLWMLGLPLVLFIYHIYLLLANRKYIQRLLKLDQLNPRQYFLIKSGKLSFIIFFVQIFNVGKLIFSFVLDDSENHPLQIVLFILNVLFDLMPIILIFIYFRNYYKEGRQLQQRSEVMSRSLVSSFNASNIL